MPKSPSDSHDPHDHGPRPATRIKPGNYSPKFLNDLKVQNKVMPVEEGWNRSLAALPPQVDWVIYPNGDLERVGFS